MRIPTNISFMNKLNKMLIMRSFGSQSKTKRNFTSEPRKGKFTTIQKQENHKFTIVFVRERSHILSSLVFRWRAPTHKHSTHTNARSHLFQIPQSIPMTSTVYGRTERTIMREQEETSRTSLPSLFVYSPSIHQPPHHFSINSIFVYYNLNYIQWNTN